VALAVASLHAQAQPLAPDWPQRAVTVVIPTAAGGPVDLLARLVAQKMAESLGQPFVADNRAGANGIVAAEMVKRAAPDGYMLMAGNSTTHGTNPWLVRNLPYDPLRDFTPIAAGANALECLAVHPGVNASTVAELVTLARARPGTLTYGSSGTGSAYHLAGEVFSARAGVTLVHVPYKGLAPALQDLVTGQTALAFTSCSGALPQARSGRLRLLAIVENARHASLPELAALPEAVPGFRKPGTWIAFFAPAGMAPSLIARINGEVVRALQSADVRTRLESAGLDPQAMSPEVLAASVRADLEAYGAIIRSIGLQPE
jgi:tripartite-type tricarboxylate transporter receptor subunit TctC